MANYAYTDEQEKATYSDTPAPGPTYPITTREVVKTIKFVRKHVPKLPDYLAYLEYLRMHDEFKFERAMQKLGEMDPEVAGKVAMLIRSNGSLSRTLGPTYYTGRVSAAAAFDSVKFDYTAWVKIKELVDDGIIDSTATQPLLALLNDEEGGRILTIVLPLLREEYEESCLRKCHIKEHSEVSDAIRTVRERP
jgi:hypothetical protein